MTAREIFLILQSSFIVIIASSLNSWCVDSRTISSTTSHGKFRQGINHASRELLVYDSVGQTTPAFEVECANVGAPTRRTQKRGINILLSCARVALEIVCYSGCLTKSSPRLWYSCSCLPFLAHMHLSRPLSSV